MKNVCKTYYTPKRDPQFFFNKNRCIIYFIGFKKYYTKLIVYNMSNILVIQVYLAYNYN